MRGAAHIRFMTDINPAAISARESARHASGQFGVQQHTAPETALGAPTLAEARTIMAALTPGTSVVLTVDGRDHACIVQRHNGTEPGHSDSKNATLGYGPGRWNMEVNAAGLAGGYYRVRVETNIERLQREAGVTDPGHPDYNSDLDSIVPATTKTYRQLITAGVDPNDEGAVEAFVNTELGLDTVPIDERPDELVNMMRQTGIPDGATILFEETDQGGRWLSPMGLRLADGAELDTSASEDAGVDWEELEWAASNIRGSEHPDFVETDRHGGYWELPPAS